MGLKAAWKAFLGHPQAPVTPPAYVHEPSPDELSKAETLAELAAQLHALHSDHTQLRLEWAETLDKFTAWANRQAARDRVRMKASMREIEGMETEGDPAQLSAFPAPAGAPAESPPANGRHPKADLYARIRRG